MRIGELRFGVLSVALAAALVMPLRAQNDDEFARRQYQSGVDFMSKRQYAEGLKDFQAVVDSFGKTSVADDALLQIALYQLDVARDLKAAQAANDKLIKDYPDSDSAPMAYVVDGRLRMAKGRAQADIDAALASFERVSRLFPGSEGVAAARYYTGEVTEITKGPAEAATHFRRVVLEFPKSIWSARATLALTTSLVRADRATSAFADLQHIRQTFPATPEATEALNLNTMLYRLYVKPAADRYVFSGKYIGAEADRLRDVIGLEVDPSGRILVGHNQGVTIYSSAAQRLSVVPSEDPMSFFVGEAGKVFTVKKSALLPEGGGPALLMTGNAGPGRQATQIDDVPAIAVMSTGERLVSDKGGKTVLRVAIGGEIAGVFANVQARRIAISRLDDVAMIDNNTKAVVVVDRNGKALSTIAARGANYQIQEPGDVAFDGLSHLFVLDVGKPAVYIFSPTYKLISTVTPTARDPLALQKPRAMAVDATGRLLIFDEKAQRVQVFQ